MYKVDPSRNVIEQINNMKATLSTTGNIGINEFGLRKWFDITKPLNDLLSYNNSVNNISENLSRIDIYLKQKYKDGKFPEKITRKYLREQTGFSEFAIKKVFNGTRGASRDFIIAICFAFKLNIIETNLLLKSAGHNELYDKDIRDIIIMKCIYNSFININYITSKIPLIDMNIILENNKMGGIYSDTSKKRKI